MVFQIERTYEFREMLMLLLSQGTSKSECKHVETDDEELMKMVFDYRKLDFEEAHRETIILDGKNEKACQQCCKIHLILVVNDSETPYTSDNPIIMKENIFNHFISNNGLPQKV